MKPPKLELTEEQKAIAAQWGRLGGKARAKKLTRKERQMIAQKASKAATEARKRNAKAKKRGEK
jgi:hypothetical protein